MLNGIFALEGRDLPLALEEEAGLAAGEERDRAAGSRRRWASLLRDAQVPQERSGPCSAFAWSTHDPGAVVREHLPTELGVERLEEPPVGRGVVVHAGRPRPTGRPLFWTAVIAATKASGTVERLERAVRVQQADLLADVGVVEEHERVRVEGDGVLLAVERQAGLKSLRVELLGSQTVLGEDVRASAPAGGRSRRRWTAGTACETPTSGGLVPDGREGELGVVGIAPGESRVLQPELRVLLAEAVPSMSAMRTPSPPPNRSQNVTVPGATGAPVTPAARVLQPVRASPPAPSTDACRKVRRDSPDAVARAGFGLRDVLNGFTFLSADAWLVDLGWSGRAGASAQLERWP